MELPDREICYRALKSRAPRFDYLLFVGVTSTGIYCRPRAESGRPWRAYPAQHLWTADSTASPIQRSTHV
jgi:methylphosphotriester-DNA--protein-cysteine methyltransferase